MDSFALIAIFIGILITVGIYLWVRQREHIVKKLATEQVLYDAGDGYSAVLVSTQYGELVHVNEPARRWLGMDGGIPKLEQIAAQTQPSDNFLNLFASETQSSFQLRNRWVEASSHTVPTQEGNLRTVIVMRELTDTKAPAMRGILDVSKAIAVINEIGEMVNASMGVEPALQVLLDIISKALPSDAGEITVLDSATGTLQPRGWTGDTRYLINLAIRGGIYEMGQGIAGTVAKVQQPLLITGVDDAVNNETLMEDVPYTSVASVPMVLNNTLIGTLVLFSEAQRAYTEADISFLQAISNAVATAVQNAVLYAQQEDRIRDIASLQEIAEQSKTTQQDTATIFGLLNERMANLLHADMCGIFLYDAERNALVPQLPIYGLPLPDTLIDSLTIHLHPDTPARNIWENQPYWVSPDLQNEPLAEMLGLVSVVQAAGIRNTGFFPMQIAGERIGIVAVSNKRDGSFTPRDIQSMRVLSTQAAIVVENLRLHLEERRIDNELLGLQEMTEAMSALDQESEFYAEITERIGRLMSSSLCGILLYDPQENALLSQAPYFGCGEDALNFTIDLPPGSVMEELWDEGAWYSNRVPTDTLVFEAGLDAIAEAAKVQQTMIVAMSAGGRRIGAIQIANTNDGRDYTNNDVRLLRIFASQAGAVIENGRLYREIQYRAEQAETLRRIAELASRVYHSDQSLESVLREVSSLTDSPVIFVNVIDTATNRLISYPQWAIGLSFEETLYQDLSQPGYENVPARNGRPFLSNDIQNDPDVLRGYRQIGTRGNIRKTLLVPLFSGDRILGELGIANRDADYTEDDIPLFSTVAAQISSAIERTQLYAQTDENLRRRVEELDAIARVSNQLMATQDLDQVLESIRDEAVTATKATGTTIAVLMPPAHWRDPSQPELDHRVGDQDKLLRLTDLEIQAYLRTTEPVIVHDYAQEESLRAMPGNARSGVAAPIQYLDDVVGTIYVYNEEAETFDDRAAGFLMTLASKASLAYQNFIYFQQQQEQRQRLSQRVDQLARIFELGQMIQSGTDISIILEAVAFSIQQSVGFDTVLMTLVDEDEGVLRRVAHAGMPVDKFTESQDRVMPLEQLQEFLKEDFRKTAETYFFPIEEVNQWYMPEMDVLSTAFEGNRSIDGVSKEHWREGDRLIVKISGQGGGMLGLVVLDRPYNNMRPDRSTIDVLEIFSHQTSTMIENTRLFIESRQSAEREAQMSEIMETVAGTLDLDQMALSIGEGTQRMLDFDRMTIALTRTDDAGFDYLKIIANADKTLQVSREHRVTLERTALGRTFEERHDFTYQEGHDAVRRYDDLRAWYDKGERSTLIVPLISGGERLGALHLGSNKRSTLSALDVRQLILRLSQLFASTLQNARLFNQAVNLQILNQSVVESIQQGIVVLDNSGRILTLNEFMRTRFGWTDDAIQSDLFAYQPALSDILKDELRKVLENGEPSESINEETTDGHEHTINRNFYLYPLRSGEQVRGAVMLVEDVTERTELQRTIESRADQLAALTDASRRITSLIDRDEVISLALEEMAEIVEFDTMTFWWRTGSYMLLEGARGFDETPEMGMQALISEEPRVQQLVETQRSIGATREAGEDALGHLPGDDSAYSWLGVPLVDQGHVAGMLVLTSQSTERYTTREEKYVTFAFASQVAIALANANLFQQTFDRTNELSTVLQAAQTTSLLRELSEVFKTVSELIINSLEMETCTIMVVDDVDNELEVQYSTDALGNELPYMPKNARYSLSDYPARARVLREREVIPIIDLEGDKAPPFPNELQSLREHDYGARLIVPLVANDEEIGIILLDQISKNEHAVTQQKVRLARTLGAQVAIAIKNTSLTEQTTQRYIELATINELSQSLSLTLKLDDMLPIIENQLPIITRADEFYLALYDETENMVTFPLATRRGESFTILPRPLGNDEVSYIIKRGHSLSLGSDYFSIEELRRSMGLGNGEGDIYSYMGVPIASGRETLGAIAIRNYETKRTFSLDDDRILTTIGTQLGAAIQNARLYEQMSGLAAGLEQTVKDRTNELAERTDQLEDERDRLDTLYQITSELSRMLNMENLLDSGLGMVGKAVTADDGVIMINHPARDSLYARAWLNPHNITYLEPDDDEPDSDIDLDPDNDTEEGKSPLAVHPAADLATWLLQNEEINDQALIVNDLHQEAFWDPDAHGAEGMRSAIAVVLEYNEDPKGVIVLLSREVNKFNDDYLKLLVPAANQMASSMSSAELYGLIRDSAKKVGRMLSDTQRTAQKNQAILEGISDGVMFADADNKIVTFNNAAERVLQIPRDQVIDQPIERLAGMYGTDSERWVETIRIWMERDEPPSNSEYVSERLDISDRVVDITLSPVFIGDIFLGTVSVFRDVTRDVETDRIKSAFIENVSHELRTPLTPVKGYTDMILMGALGELNDEQRHIMNVIKDNVDRLNTLLNDVLKIAKLGRGDGLVISRIDLQEFLSQIIEQVASKPDNIKKDMQTTLNVPDDMPLLRADRDKLYDIARNVIENAFNYTLPNGKIDVTVDHEAATKSALIAIADNGVGIPDSYKDRVWQRFERNQEHAVELEVVGTGLGLSLARELVEVHDGEIWFESEEGQGTTFFIRIPLDPSHFIEETREMLKITTPEE